MGSLWPEGQPSFLSGCFLAPPCCRHGNPRVAQLPSQVPMEPLQSRSSTAAAAEAEAVDSRRRLWRTQIGLAVILDQNTPKRCPAASAFSNMAHPGSHPATLKVDSACDNTHHSIITLKLWDSLQNMSDPWPTNKSHSVARP